MKGKTVKAKLKAALDSTVNFIAAHPKTAGAIALVFIAVLVLRIIFH